MTVYEKQNEILKDFNDIGDPFDQYAYLIELSGKLSPLDDGYKTEEYSVKGCQSTVWLHLYERDGCVFFDADSNTFIMKGILFLLQKVLQGETFKNVCEADIFFLKDASITGTFESARHKGIGHIIETIKKFALERI